MQYIIMLKKTFWYTAYTVDILDIKTGNDLYSIQYSIFAQKKKKTF